MYILTPVLYHFHTVIIEVYVQCFPESAGVSSHKELGRSTFRAEISSRSSTILKAVKKTLPGSFLNGANSELKVSSYRTESLQLDTKLFFNISAEIFSKINLVTGVTILKTIS